MSFDGENIYAITANNDASGAYAAGAGLSVVACSARLMLRGHLITQSIHDLTPTLQVWKPHCTVVPGESETSLLHKNGSDWQFMATHSC